MQDSRHLIPGVQDSFQTRFQIFFKDQENKFLLLSSWLFLSTSLCFFYYILSLSSFLFISFFLFCFVVIGGGQGGEVSMEAILVEWLLYLENLEINLKISEWFRAVKSEFFLSVITSLSQTYTQNKYLTISLWVYWNLKKVTKDLRDICNLPILPQRKEKILISFLCKVNSIFLVAFKHKRKQSLL